MLRCRSYTLTSSSEDARRLALNLDGELSGAAPFRASCVPGALEVFAADRLREAPNNTSDELEPQLVLAVCEACEAMGLA